MSGKILTKKELIEAIAGQTGGGKKEVNAFLDALSDTIIDQVSAGNTVPLNKVGRISAKMRSARTGINPSTKKPLNIPAKRVPRISWGSAMKSAVEG